MKGINDTIIDNVCKLMFPIVEGTSYVQVHYLATREQIQFQGQVCKYRMSQDMWGSWQLVHDIKPQKSVSTLTKLQDTTNSLVIDHFHQQ